MKVDMKTMYWDKVALQYAGVLFKIIKSKLEAGVI